MKTDWVKDDHFCDFCRKTTKHACKYSDHERDSSRDHFICLSCFGEFLGMSGKYEIPYNLEDIKNFVKSVVG